MDILTDSKNPFVARCVGRLQAKYPQSMIMVVDHNKMNPREERGFYHSQFKQKQSLCSREATRLMLSRFSLTV